MLRANLDVSAGHYNGALYTVGSAPPSQLAIAKDMFAISLPCSFNPRYAGDFI